MKIVSVSYNTHKNKHIYGKFNSPNKAQIFRKLYNCHKNKLHDLHNVYNIKLQ